MSGAATQKQTNKTEIRHYNTECNKGTYHCRLLLPSAGSICDYYKLTLGALARQRNKF